MGLDSSYECVPKEVSTNNVQVFYTKGDASLPKDYKEVSANNAQFFYTKGNLSLRKDYSQLVGSASAFERKRLVDGHKTQHISRTTTHQAPADDIIDQVVFAAVLAHVDGHTRELHHGVEATRRRHTADERRLREEEGGGTGHVRARHRGAVEQVVPAAWHRGQDL